MDSRVSLRKFRIFWNALSRLLITSPAFSNEFRTLNGTCASLVPQGPGYETVSLTNQVCATVGSVAGQNYVDGNAFIKASYGYSYSNEWLVRLLLFD